MTAITLETLLERAAIQSVLDLYATALDNRDWAALDEVFAKEASTHYEGMGHFDGRDAIVQFISQVLNQCGPTQHLLGNYRIEVDGDTATAKCYLAAIHAGIGDYQGQTQTVWGEYRDRLVKTPAGWRIVHHELAGIHGEGDVGIK